jgi:hypothetical protein
MRRICLALLAIVLAACTVPSAQPQSPLAQPASPLLIRRYYVPMVSGLPAAPVGRPSCLTMPATERFYSLLATDGRQQRPRMRCNAALVRAAQARADGLVRSDLVGHCDVAGNCANRYARVAGCRLPAYYSENGNNIESLAAGSALAEAVFIALARSPSHAAHLFGQNDFFREQVDVGIAVATGGKYGWWWVVMIGICE